MENHTITEINKIYDELYKKADTLIKKYNPCKIENGACRKGIEDGISFCCYGCRYLGRKGCTVKALGCKLGFCDLVYRDKNNDELIKEFKILREEARKFDFIFFRRSRKEILDMVKLYKKRKDTIYQGL